MDSGLLAAVAARRSTLYWVLAELLLTCPDEGFLAGLRRSFHPGAASAASDDFAANLAAIAEALPADRADIQESAVEYTRLFGAVSPAYGPPPPYESAHRHSAAPAEVAAAVSGFYAGAGLSPGDNAVPPDHLGVELKFLALLCHEEGEAWRIGATEDAVRVLRQEYGFFDRHLRCWAANYLAGVQADAKHPFYRGVASLTAKVIAQEETLMEELIADFERV